MMKEEVMLLLNRKIKNAIETAELDACMFFELGWRAADESMIDKCCNLVNEFEDKFKKEMAKCL